MKKIWGVILTTLATLATYIGVNQFTNRNGNSQIQSGGSRNTPDYGLGLPKSAGTGGATRNKEK